MKLADILRQVDYNNLDISDYSRRYIQLLLPILDYYLDICNHALDLLAVDPTTQSPRYTLVDYGGGHGFLSLLAKQRGIPHVIYIDHNPQASATVTALAERLGFGPDTILTGDHNTLGIWCREQQVTPDALVGIDVIEHIYRLDTFFSGLMAVNPRMHILFSTASNPSNPFTKHRLKRIMRMDEDGTASQKGFRELRRDHCATLRPDLTSEELDRWAYATRGLTFEDMAKLLNDRTSTPPSLTDIPPYPNTCDPVTGSWTERILPLKSYRALAVPRQVTIHNGFYNSHQPGIKSLAARGLNTLLRLPHTQWFAPFIILEMGRE